LIDEGKLADQFLGLYDKLGLMKDTELEIGLQGLDAKPIDRPFSLPRPALPSTRLKGDCNE
jgi:hypothetical protein